jgi:hypothetical protein
MRLYSLLVACSIALSCWIPNESSALTQDDGPVYGMGAGRRSFSLLCWAYPGVPYAPNEEVDACVYACVESQDAEDWSAYVYHCRIATPYDAQACADAIAALDSTGCADRCCPKPAPNPPGPVGEADFI